MKLYRILLSSGAVAGLAALFLAAGPGYACACKKKTAGYFQKMGIEVAAAATGVLPGVAQSLSGISGDPGRGRLVAINRRKGNCLACHKISKLSDQPFHGEIGPSLDGIARRYQESQLRQLVIDARKFFPQTVMPPFYVREGLYRVATKHQGKSILTAQEVEDVVAFLKTLR